MNPEITDPKWTAYLLGELSETDRQRAETQLAENGELRQHVEQLADTLALTREALAQALPGSETIAQDCRNALPKSPLRIPLALFFPTALAAGLALFLGLRVLLPSGPTPALMDEAGNEIDPFAADGIIIPETRFQDFDDAVNLDTLPPAAGENLSEAPVLGRRALSLREETSPQPSSAPPPAIAPAPARFRQQFAAPHEPEPYVAERVEESDTQAQPINGVLSSLALEAASPADTEEEEEDDDEEDDEEDEEKDDPHPPQH